jgi:hypothetical protein
MSGLFDCAGGINDCTTGASGIINIVDCTTGTNEIANIIDCTTGAMNIQCHLTLIRLIRDIRDLYGLQLTKNCLDDFAKLRNMILAVVPPDDHDLEFVKQVTDILEQMSVFGPDLPVDIYENLPSRLQKTFPLQPRWVYIHNHIDIPVSCEGAWNVKNYCRELIGRCADSKFTSMIYFLNGKQCTRGEYLGLSYIEPVPEHVDIVPYSISFPQQNIILGKCVNQLLQKYNIATPNKAIINGPQKFVEYIKGILTEDVLNLPDNKLVIDCLNWYPFTYPVAWLSEGVEIWRYESTSYGYEVFTLCSRKNDDPISLKQMTYYKGERVQL